MNIYIPKHLRRIKVVDQLCQLIIEYSKQKQNSDTVLDSEYYYNKYKTLSYDAVKKFVGICIALENVVDEDYISNKTNYITEIFYYLSGSYKVFEMLEKLMDFNMEVEYKIELGYLRIVIKEDTYNNIFSINEEIYKEGFVDFLSTLLYFKKAELVFEKKNIDIEKTNEVVTVINSNPVLYKKFNFL